MATVVLQVLIDVDEVNEDSGSVMQAAVKELLTESGELSGAFFQEHGITDVNVVFEDVI